MTNIKKIDIDVLIPTCDGYDDIVALVKKMKLQRYVNIKNIVVPITLVDPINDEKLKQFCDENNIICFDVEKSYFSHSLTRQRAIKKFCKSDIVVMFSQDVHLTNNMSFYNLVKDIANGECVYAYGRQVCPKRSIERYIREKNYPNYSYFVSKDDIPEMGLLAFFSSDAFSAINRNVFIEIGGYQDYDIMMNEDMLYSYFVLNAGYKKKYCADAPVIHYHSYSFRRLYKRYYETGRFFAKVKIFDEYKMTDSGKDLAKYVLKQCFLHVNIIGLLRWLPDMACRYIGMKRGLKAK